MIIVSANSVDYSGSFRKEAWAGVPSAVNAVREEVKTPALTSALSSISLIDKTTMEQARLTTIGINLLKRLDAPGTKIRMRFPKFLEWLSCEATVLNECMRTPELAAKIAKIFKENLEDRIHEIIPVVPCMEFYKEAGVGFPKIILVPKERRYDYFKYDEGYFSEKALTGLLRRRILTCKAEVDAIVVEAAESAGIAWGYTLNGCNMRARILYEALRCMGIPKEMMVFQYQRGPDLLHNWRYHVALAVKLASGELLVLDPALDSLCSMTVEDWIRTFHNDKGYKLTSNERLEVGDCGDRQTFHVPYGYNLQIDGNNFLVKNETRSLFTKTSDEIALHCAVSQLFKCTVSAPQLSGFLTKISLNPSKLWLPPNWSELFDWAVSYGTLPETTKRQPEHMLVLPLDEIKNLTWPRGFKVAPYSLATAIGALTIGIKYCQAEIIKIDAGEEAVLPKRSTLESYMTELFKKINYLKTEI